ncbi:hypothetical protein SAMN04487830_11531 [Pseudobutyrivibrio sp. OR37]|uniref:hypothetical protein n=1 Tax=Pseudobutyrivibrio sp. OR37 TaxID=1798186 RepID=UPI0008F363D4|nr:hypothetical protein [Pseudobutyrivibrio sp. OR37]SFH97568.1 hypothetical protein SAMN04487830_11531 [Pseudobutyrivibrio sp. OR37]
MAKKVSKLLKGVAITGAAVGGGISADGANLAYAMEENDDGTLSIAVSEETTQETIVESELHEESPVEVAEVVTEPEETSEVISEEITSASLTDEEIYQSLEASLSEEDIALASTSEFQSESLESTSTSLSEAIVETTTNYENESQAFAESPYAKDGVDELEKEAKEALKNSDDVIEKVAEQNKRLDGNNFYTKDVARNLAFEMIKYKLLITGEVDAVHANNIEYSFYTNDGYENHHFVIKYSKLIDGTLTYQERYYDYVTCDHDGNSLFHDNNNSEDIAKNVGGINVVEKSPIYSNQSKQQIAYKGTDYAEKYTYKQRIGFEKNDAGSTKGVDWYTRDQFLADLANHQAYKDNIAAYSSQLTSLSNYVSELMDSTSASISASESAAVERYNSISQMRAQSESARIQKSESLSASESISTSESLSVSESLSTSESISVSESLSVSESISTSESLAAAARAARGAAASASASSTAAAAVTSSVPAPVAAEADTEVQVVQNASVNTTANTPANGNAGVAGRVVGDEVTPLAVVEDELEEAAPHTIRTIPEEVINNSQIGDEDVAKSAKDLKASSQGGFLFALLAAIIGKRTYDKTKKETDEQI